MQARLLCESGTLHAREGGKWSVTLITPGEGSSGTYSEEMLAEHGPKAFKAGMKMWWGHPKEGEGPGDRDARDQWGYLEEDAAYAPGEGLSGKVVLLPHWKDVVESLGTQASLSIYAMGESDDEGNVTSLAEASTNSVDIVSYPGRPGSGFKKKLEAARAASVQPATASVGDHNNQEESMDEVLKAIEALATKFDTFLSEQKDAADKAAQAEADAQAKDKDVSEAVEAAVDAVEAVKAAKVLPSFESKLIEKAKKGGDITEDLAFAVEVTKEAAAPKQEAADGVTFIYESADDKADDFILNIGGK